MPTYDLGLFDSLEEYAIALNDAHATYLTATKPSDELDAAIEEGTELPISAFMKKGQRADLGAALNTL